MGFGWGGAGSDGAKTTGARSATAAGAGMARRRNRSGSQGDVDRVVDLVAEVGLDGGEPADDVFERAVHGLERILRLALHLLEAGDVAQQRVDLGRRFTAGGADRVGKALMFEVDEQLGEAAFDRLEMVEAVIGGVEFLHECGDPAFEMTERGLVAAADLNILDPVDQSADHALKFGRHAMGALAVLVARFERVGERPDPPLQHREHLGTAGRTGGLVDLGGERAHLLGEVRQRVVRRHMRDDATHGDDGAFKLLEGRRILAVAGDQLDFMRERLHRFAEAGEAFGRRQRAERVAYLREPLLEVRQRRGVGAGLPGLVDAVRKLAHLAFERLDRLARHGFLQHDADLGEIVAERVDRLVETAGAVEHLDLAVDLAELLLKSGKFLREGARQCVG